MLVCYDCYKKIHAGKRTPKYCKDCEGCYTNWMKYEEEKKAAWELAGRPGSPYAFIK